jgi:hypothetical protein
MICFNHWICGGIWQCHVYGDIFQSPDVMRAISSWDDAQLWFLIWTQKLWGQTYSAFAMCIYIYILLLYIIHIYFFLYSVYVMDCVCSVYMCIYHMMYRETGKHRDTYGQKQKHSGILSSRDHCMKRKLDITTTRWLLCQAGIPLSSDLERYSRSMYDVLCTGPQSVHCFASTSLLPTPIRSIFISNPAATQNFVKMYWAQIFSKHFLDDTNMFSHVSTFTPNHCGP